MTAWQPDPANVLPPDYDMPAGWQQPPQVAIPVAPRLSAAVQGKQPIQVDSEQAVELTKTERAAQSTSGWLVTLAILLGFILGVAAVISFGDGFHTLGATLGIACVTTVVGYYAVARLLDLLVELVWQTRRNNRLLEELIRRQ